VVLQDIRTQSGVSTTTTFLYGLDLISATDHAGATSYYLTDGLGSTRALTDSAGAVTDTYSYDVYGAVRAQTGATNNDFRFTGEHADDNANRGLYYLRARHYDPALGRFLSKDPVPFVNRYAYVLNNPANLVDPSGRCHDDTRYAHPVAAATPTPAKRIGPEKAAPTGSHPCAPPKIGSVNWWFADAARGLRSIFTSDCFQGAVAVAAVAAAIAVTVAVAVPAAGTFGSIVAGGALVNLSAAYGAAAAGAFVTVGAQQGVLTDAITLSEQGVSNVGKFASCFD
jgi:RHS repeat-associated protein